MGLSCALDGHHTTKDYAAICPHPEAHVCNGLRPGCQRHRPQTWEVRCSVCKRPKWPYEVEEPAEPYVCVLCRMRPKGVREAKQRAARARGRHGARRSAGSEP
jgi:hypothetical protein